MMEGCLIALLSMLSIQGVNMALIHPNEWQIMLKSERLTRDLQMACYQHADSSKKQSNKIIICLFSAFYARISKSIQSFAHEMTTVLPRMAETGLTFSVGVPTSRNQKKASAKEENS